MALDKKLKIDMTSETLDEAAKAAVPTRNAPPVPPAAPAPTPTFTQTPDPVPTPSTGPAPAPTPAAKPVFKPAAAPTPAPESSPVQPSSAVMDRLAAIERSLSELSKQLGALETDFSAYQSKATNPEPVFQKINTVHTDMQKLIAALSQQTQAPQPEDRTDDLISQLQALSEKQDKTERMLTQALRENATFQQQVRRGMQSDLDELREQLSGTSFNPILKEIATMYSFHHSVLDDADIPEKSLKELRDLFEHMEDLLSDYGAEVVNSSVGDLRPKNQCKIVEKLPTGDESKHNTIARSRKPGIIRDRLVLCHEVVDVYVYDPALKPAPAPGQTDDPIPTGDTVPDTSSASESAGEIEIPDPQQF